MTGYESKRAAAQDKLDSTEREALKLALDAFGEIAWSNEIQWQRDRAKEAITAIKEALAQPAQDKLVMTKDEQEIYENGFIDGMQHQMKSTVEKAVNAMIQPAQEQNFCPLCGKQTWSIHTCTPPQENT